MTNILYSNTSDHFECRDRSNSMDSTGSAQFRHQLSRQYGSFRRRQFGNMNPNLTGSNYSFNLISGELNRVPPIPIDPPSAFAKNTLDSTISDRLIGNRDNYLSLKKEQSIMTRSCPRPAGYRYVRSGSAADAFGGAFYSQSVLRPGSSHSTTTDTSINDNHHNNKFHNNDNINTPTSSRTNASSATHIYNKNSQLNHSSASSKLLTPKHSQSLSHSSSSCKDLSTSTSDNTTFMPSSRTFQACVSPSSVRTAPSPSIIVASAQSPTPANQRRAHVVAVSPSPTLNRSASCFPAVDVSRLPPAGQRRIAPVLEPSTLRRLGSSEGGGVADALHHHVEVTRGAKCMSSEAVAIANGHSLERSGSISWSPAMYRDKYDAHGFSLEKNRPFTAMNRSDSPFLLKYGNPGGVAGALQPDAVKKGTEVGTPFESRTDVSRVEFGQHQLSTEDYGNHFASFNPDFSRKTLSIGSCRRKEIEDQRRQSASYRLTQSPSTRLTAYGFVNGFIGDEKNDTTDILKKDNNDNLLNSRHANTLTTDFKCQTADVLMKEADHHVRAHIDEASKTLHAANPIDAGLGIFGSDGDIASDFQSMKNFDGNNKTVIDSHPINNADHNSVHFDNNTDASISNKDNQVAISRSPSSGTSNCLNVNNEAFSNSPGVKNIFSPVKIFCPSPDAANFKRQNMSLGEVRGADGDEARVAWSGVEPLHVEMTRNNSSSLHYSKNIAENNLFLNDEQLKYYVSGKRGDVKRGFTSAPASPLRNLSTDSELYDTRARIFHIGLGSPLSFAHAGSHSTSKMLKNADTNDQNLHMQVLKEHNDLRLVSSKKSFHDDPKKDPSRSICFTDLTEEERTKTSKRCFRSKNGEIRGSEGVKMAITQWAIASPDMTPFGNRRISPQKMAKMAQILTGAPSTVAFDISSVSKNDVHSQEDIDLLHEIAQLPIPKRMTILSRESHIFDNVTKGPCIESNHSKSPFAAKKMESTEMSFVLQGGASGGIWKNASDSDRARTKKNISQKAENAIGLNQRKSELNLDLSWGTKTREQNPPSKLSVVHSRISKWVKSRGEGFSKK